MQTVTAFFHFLLAMMLHPQVAKKAQMEIEAAVGTDRLPTLADRPSLPYVNALMSEVLRWGTPVPLGTSVVTLYHALHHARFSVD